MGWFEIVPRVIEQAACDAERSRTDLAELTSADSNFALAMGAIIADSLSRASSSQGLHVDWVLRAFCDEAAKTPISFRGTVQAAAASYMRAVAAALSKRHHPSE